MNDSTKAAQRGEKRHKALPEQLRVGWVKAAHITAAFDPLHGGHYHEWQHALKRPHDYDWTATVPAPEGWTGTGWKRLARSIISAMRGNRAPDAAWSDDHLQHVTAHVRKLRRAGLIPDWAANNPLDTIPAKLIDDAMKLWAFHSGVVYLCVMPHDRYPVELADAASTTRTMQAIRKDITKLVGKSPCWAGIEATVQGEQEVMGNWGGDWEVTDTITRGTGWHTGLVLGPDVERSGCSYVRRAATVFDLIFWMHYHAQGHDSRLKIRAMPAQLDSDGQPTDPGNAVRRVVTAGDEYRAAWLTVHIPTGWEVSAAQAVAEGLACRAGLANLKRERLPDRFFKVQGGRLNTVRLTSASLPLLDSLPPQAVDHRETVPRRAILPDQRHRVTLTAFLVPQHPPRLTRPNPMSRAARRRAHRRGDRQHRTRSARPNKRYVQTQNAHNATLKEELR